MVNLDSAHDNRPDSRRSGMLNRRRSTGMGARSKDWASGQERRSAVASVGVPFRGGPLRWDARQQLIGMVHCGRQASPPFGYGWSKGAVGKSHDARRRGSPTSALGRRPMSLKSHDLQEDEQSTPTTGRRSRRRRCVRGTCPQVLGYRGVTGCQRCGISGARTASLWRTRTGLGLYARTPRSEDRGSIELRCELQTRASTRAGIAGNS